MLFNVIVACLIVPVIVRIILPFLLRAQPSKDNIVRMPRFFGIAGVICGVLAFAGLFALHFYRNSLFQVLVGCCAVLSCTNVLISNSFFLVYDDDGFTVWRLLQRSHRFQYADITGIRPYGDSSFRLLLRNGSVLIDAMAVGGSEFAAFAEARYCETTGAFCIPDNRSGLFNGNVLNPIQFVVAGGLFIACGAVAVICTTIGFLESRELPVPSNARIVHFEQCTQKDQELLLLADGTDFSVCIDAVMNQQGLEQAIFRGEQFIMQCEKNTSYICTLTGSDGTRYITVDSVYNAAIAYMRLVCAISWIVFAFMCFITAGSGYVLSNAPRYPRLAALLVKKKYRNY